MKSRFDYVVQLAPCAVTNEFAKVIRTNLGKVCFKLDSGETGECQVDGQFSEAGLELMLNALRAAPMPIPVEFEAVPEEAVKNLKYQWLAVYEDGRIAQQLDPDGTEHHLGEVNLHEVQEFVLRPRDLTSSLPWFQLCRSRGLLRRATIDQGWERLALPLPEVPFHIEYQRRVTKVLCAGPAHGVQDYPTQVRHELGWRVDTLHGNDYETTLLIGVEDDNGSWQIVKWEPADSPHLGNKRIYGEVVILDALERVGT